MDSAIIGAVIAAGASLCAAVIAREGGLPLSPPTKRHRALKGQWQGGFEKHSPKPDTPKDYEMSVEIAPGWRSVRGRAMTHCRTEAESLDQPLLLRGRFLHDKYLMMEYRAADANIVEFGTMLLSLSSDAHTLSGEFVGYGRRSEGIITAEMRLKKVL